MVVLKGGDVIVSDGQLCSGINLVAANKSMKDVKKIVR